MGVLECDMVWFVFGSALWPRCGPSAVVVCMVMKRDRGLLRLAGTADFDLWSWRWWRAVRVILDPSPLEDWDALVTLVFVRIFDFRFSREAALSTHLDFCRFFAAEHKH